MTLKVDQLHFTYDGVRPVIRDMTAEAEAGRVTAIIGPNAAGKTTLARLMCGLLESARGRILIENRDLEHYGVEERAAALAYVAQRPRVDAPFTVEDVVAFGRFCLPPDHDAIQNALTGCSLDHLADTPYPELSVGQQQRVSLARAMAQLSGGGPAKTIILDEPMSAMDPRHVMLAAKLLRRMAHAGTTVVVVLHDLPTAVRLADDAWVLRDGEMVACGPVPETLTPDRLEAVFRVPFTATTGEGAVPIPLAAWPEDDRTGNTEQDRSRFT